MHQTEISRLHIFSGFLRQGKFVFLLWARKVSLKELFFASNLKITSLICIVSKNNHAHRAQRPKLHIVGFSKFRKLKHEHFVRTL